MMAEFRTYDTRADAQILAFGCNREGQVGLGNGDDIVITPTALCKDQIDSSTVLSIVISQKQSFLLTRDGSVLNCGENDNNELGRSGKRSIFRRVDSLEAYTISDIALGDGFTLLLSKDGKLISWGQNSLGQLGSGDREFRDKPKLNSAIPNDTILQIAAGLQHVVALSKSGNVLTWGGNRKGQLGDGQLTSSCTPRVLPQLRHRPVISISCGENHSMALTIGGSVYAWGENSNGQLGTGDTTHRLRPELIRSLRAAKAKLIRTGKQHSMVVSSRGLLFAFGSNSHGQLGLGSMDIRLESHPTVVERLREVNVIDVACGSAHTLVLSSVAPANNHNSTSHHCVYAMGLNSSGQLGLGHVQSVCSPTIVTIHPMKEISPMETDLVVHKIPKLESIDPVAISCNALAFHSYIISSGVPLARPALPSVDLASLRDSVNKVMNNRDSSSEKGNVALRSLREMLAAAFSSLSVLNASFRLPDSIGSSSSIHEHASSLNIDLQAVRQSYQLLFSTENDQIIATLGRATLQLADHLKECPFDDTENLSVFLIVLENPLMLRPASFHIAIERVVSGILALPRTYRVTLFNWLRSCTSEYFSSALSVFQCYLSFALTSKVNNIDPAPAVLVLSSLYECNRVEKILPNSYFYCSTLARSVNLNAEWQRFKEAGPDSKVFNFFAYPFLIEVLSKSTILHSEFNERKRSQCYAHLSKYVYSKGVVESSSQPLSTIQSLLPAGVKVSRPEDSDNRLNVYFEITVTRERLLYDLLGSIDKAIHDDPQSLRLPLRVIFDGEDASDLGGVTKELFTLSIKQLLKDSGITTPCNKSFVWFTSNLEVIKKSKFAAILKVMMHSPSNIGGNTHDKPIGEMSAFPNLFGSIGNTNEDNTAVAIARILGLLVGLASYHNVLTDVPFPPSIYKIMASADPDLSLEDLYAVDSNLGKSLKYLLEFEEGSIQDSLGVSFTASVNPLIDDMSENSSQSSSPEYVNLKPSGDSIYVDRGNRCEFVKLFTRHALYGSCKSMVDAYLLGIRNVFGFGIYSDKLIALCTHEEIEILLSGTRDIGDLSELRMQTIYKGEYHDEHPMIQDFWNILSEMHSYEKHNFLHFVTGSDRIPVGGISKLGLIIQSTGQSSSALPSSHTCFNILNIPSSYESAEVLKSRLNLAIIHFEGFGFA